MTPFDKVGKEIKVGSIIAYGHALDRSAALRIGKVLKITPSNPEYHYDSGFKITVWGVDDEWSSIYENPGLCKSKGTLLFPDRMVVLDPAMLPPIYAELLSPITEKSTFKSLGSPERRRITSCVNCHRTKLRHKAGGFCYYQSEDITVYEPNPNGV